MTPHDVLEVLDPGLLTTVQDTGRPDLAGLGVAPGGAADPWSMAVANALVDNPPGSAVLEATLAGAAFQALRRVTVGLAGADLGALIEPGARTLPSGSSATLAAGDVLRFTGGAGAGPRGLRAYLAIPGGIGLAAVLGSRSTALGAGFGGFEGRALRAGDRLRAAAPDDLVTVAARWPGPAEPLPWPNRVDALRVLAGPAAGSSLADLASRAWTIAAASDRVGLRLAGDPLPGVFTGELASHGLVTGAIQVPPGGLPIILLPDHQPTGGYPVVAIVISADRPLLGQLTPGDRVGFVPVGRDDAVAALRHSREAFAAALGHLREQRGWDDLAGSAGG